MEPRYRRSSQPPKIQKRRSLSADISGISPSNDDSNGERGYVEVTILKKVPDRIPFAIPIENNSARRTNEKLIMKNNSFLKFHSTLNNKKCLKSGDELPQKIWASEEVECNRDGPLVELGALHKILDRLSPDDLESTSAWYSSESCCREIVLRFQNLLGEWASDKEKLDRCLRMDRTLTKCEHCGVIKCSEVSQGPKDVVGEKNSANKNMDSVKNSHPVVMPRCRPNSATREKLASRINRIPVSVKSTNANGRGIVDRYSDKKITKNHNSVKTQDSTNVPLIETVKYLARGNISVAETDKSQDFSDRNKLLEQSYLPKLYNERKQSFIIHDSRDMDFRANSNYFLSDRSRFEFGDEILSETSVKRRDGTVILGSLNGSQGTVNFSQYNDAECLQRGSDTSIFSSSSAENFIHRWIEPDSKDIIPAINSERRNYAGNNYFFHGLEANVRPSSDNVRTIGAQIAGATHKFAKSSVVAQGDLDDRPEVGIPSIPFKKSSKTELPKYIDQSCHKIDNSMGTCHRTKDEDSREISKETSNTHWEKIVEAESPSVFDRMEVTAKITHKNLISATSGVSSRSLSCHEASVGNSERFERQILYDEISSRKVASRDDLTAASRVLLIYRKIVESNEEMDWESFQQLVTAFHPSQRELWLDICKTVSNEARRVADETGATTEVCIEINPQPSCTDKKGIIRSHGDETAFELDMTLKDLHAILETSEQSEGFLRDIKRRKN